MSRKVVKGSAYLHIALGKVKKIIRRANDKKKLIIISTITTGPVIRCFV